MLAHAAGVRRHHHLYLGPRGVQWGQVVDVALQLFAQVGAVGWTVAKDGDAAVLQVMQILAFDQRAVRSPRNGSVGGPVVRSGSRRVRGVRDGLARREVTARACVRYWLPYDFGNGLRHK